jgi:hypothetical protein
MKMGNIASRRRYDAALEGALLQENARSTGAIGPAMAMD